MPHPARVLTAGPGVGGAPGVAAGCGVQPAPPGQGFGVQPATPPPLQSQSQGGHVSPAGHAGQAQTQPPLPSPPPVGSCWQTPLTHGTPTSQGRPSANQTHAFALSARQVSASVWPAQGSVVPQSHGSQASPSIHAGHSHVRVDGGDGGGTPPPSQLQSHGGHDSPTRHSGH